MRRQDHDWTTEALPGQAPLRHCRKCGLPKRPPFEAQECEGVDTAEPAHTTDYNPHD